MRRLLLSTICTLLVGITYAAPSYDNPDTIVVARDGTGQFRTITDAIEVCRAFMDYHKVIYIKKGTYKEKLIIPQWLKTLSFVVRIVMRPSSPMMTMRTFWKTSHLSPLTSHLVRLALSAHSRSGLMLTTLPLRTSPSRITQPD